MNLIRGAARMFGAALLGLLLPLAATAAGKDEPVKVVYHFDSGFDQATKGLRNIKNHLDVDPKTK
ncbi:MAG TPA: hypothetical protein VFV17_04440, partial [Usitatibacteraceae bacterium]|nr:hypothetical protein [Usitatibacteraceae bacterium]